MKHIDQMTEQEAKAELIAILKVFPLGPEKDQSLAELIALYEIQRRRLWEEVHRPPVRPRPNRYGERANGYDVRSFRRKCGR